MMCRICGCVDEDCANCVRRTGEPCRWVAPDLCSACVVTAAELLDMQRVLLAMARNPASRAPLVRGRVRARRKRVRA